MMLLFPERVERGAGRGSHLALVSLVQGPPLSSLLPSSSWNLKDSQLALISSHLGTGDKLGPI